MKKVLIALSVLLMSSITESGDAKAQNLDSLYSIWQDPAQPDSTRVAAYKDYIWEGYLFSRPDTAETLAGALHTFAKAQQYPIASAKAFNLQGIANAVQGSFPRALEYYQKSLMIYEEIRQPDGQLGDKKGIAECLNNIGFMYNNQGNYSRALEYYQKSLAIREEIRLPDGQLGDKKGIAHSLNNISNIYFDQGNYPRALEYYQKSLAIHEEIRLPDGQLGDKKGIANSLTYIGNIYHEQDNYPRALEYYQKSLAIWEEILLPDGEVSDKSGIATSLNNIGIIYAAQANYPRALKYLKKSLVIREEIGHRTGIASTLDGIGLVYHNQDSTNKALEYYYKALNIKKELGDKYSMAHSFVAIGNSYLKQSKYSLTLDYCHKGLILAEDIGTLDRQMEACQCLYDTYSKLGKDKEALKYFEQMIEVRDSLYNEENTKKLTRLEMQYDFDKKEAETKAEQEKKDALAVQELKRQKLVRNGFMGGFAVVFLFAGVFFTQRNRIGKEKKRSETLLLNILPAEVAEELKAKGAAEAQLIEQVTVLFTDFKGFTAMSELVSAKELVADLHACFTEFDHICEKYGIEKIKTIGDAYMAAGGLPTPNTTHAQDVVNAALEMARIVEEGKAKKIAAGLPYFQVRIGVHTGPVVAGIVGVKKFQYDIWGDTVNTASRMESSGAVGKVNISQSTYKLLKDTSTSLSASSDFAFESRGKIAAKGKGEIEMWFVQLKNK